MIRDLLAEAWSELWRAKLRTGLAVAAIAVGAFAVSIIASVYELARLERVQERAREWRDVSIPPPVSGPFDRPAHMKRHYLMPEDGSAIEHDCPYIDRLLVFGMATADAKAGRETRGCGVYLDNTANEGEFLVPPARTKLAQGRCFTASEIASAARVAIINQTLRRQLFGTGPVGRFLRLNGVQFEVIGVEEHGSLRYSVPEVVIPYTAGQDLLFDVSWSFFVHPKPGMEEQAATRIDEILSARIGDPRETFVHAGGSVSSSSDYRAYAYFGLVGVLTLLSATLALSNKAYIDVIERADQIALRRALGATAQRIYGAVLLQTVLLCGAGCTIGGTVGWLAFSAGTREAQRQSGIPVAFPLIPVAAVLLSTVTLGIAAGLQGAAAATKVDPARMLNRKDLA